MRVALPYIVTSGQCLSTVEFHAEMKAASLLSTLGVSLSGPQALGLGSKSGAEGVPVNTLP